MDVARGFFPLKVAACVFSVPAVSARDFLLPAVLARLGAEGYGSDSEYSLEFVPGWGSFTSSGSWATVCSRPGVASFCEEAFFSLCVATRCLCVFLKASFVAISQQILSGSTCDDLFFWFGVVPLALVAASHFVARAWVWGSCGFARVLAWACAEVARRGLSQHVFFRSSSAAMEWLGFSCLTAEPF